MKWIAGALLIAFVGLLLRGYLRSGHLRDSDGERNRPEVSGSRFWGRGGS
ncbi:MAG: hypothetical protein QM698_15170 [Micropepsaceae bacterium]